VSRKSQKVFSENQREVHRSSREHTGLPHTNFLQRAALILEGVTPYSWRSLIIPSTLNDLLHPQLQVRIKLVFI
jgi:hypothetical protein